MIPMPLEVKIGEEAVFTKTITAADVSALADVTGDHNPLHLDPTFAARTRFGKPIAHGVLTTGLVSATIARHFVRPSVNVILVSANYRFRQPVYIGDTVSACIRVRRFDPNRGLVFLDTECLNQRGETVLSGDVVIMLEALADA